MIVSAANNIANLQDEINKLNVFPVPDGDTGTNMSLTMQAGKNAVDNFNGGLTECADKVASALLRGGRGNSGVILSLFFFHGTIIGTREGTIITALCTGFVVKKVTALIRRPLERILVEPGKVKVEVQ